MKEGDRIELWRRRLTSKFNVCYYACLVRRVEKQDAWLRSSTAIFSAGTVATLLAKAGSPWPETAAIVTTLLSVIRTTSLDTGRRLEQYGGLYGRWLQLAHRYHDLWLRAIYEDLPDLEEATIKGEMARLADFEVDVRTSEKSVPEIERLRERCQARVLREEGLP